MPYMHVRASTAPTEDIPQTSLYLYGMDMYTCMQVYVDHVGRAYMTGEHIRKLRATIRTFVYQTIGMYVRMYVCVYLHIL